MTNQRQVSKYKQMAFETAVRNPERYLGILSALLEYEGKTLNDENLLTIVSNLYLAGEVSSTEIVITENTKIGDIKDAVRRVNMTRRADGGFPQGYSSRFWTYMRTPSELGFVYARYNKPFRISNIAKKLIAGELDEQEAFSIQAMRFNRRSPYRNVSNDYNFFKLAINLLLERKERGKKLSYEQFISMMFNKTGEIKETVDILDNNSFNDEQDVFKFVGEHYQNTNKIKTVTRDYPDVVRRVMIISGFITIRYSGKKFIEINESKINYIKEIMNIEFSLSDEEKEDAEKYFNRLNGNDDAYISIVQKYRKEDAIEGFEYSNKIRNIIKEYSITEEIIIKSINAIYEPRNEVIHEFKEIPAPLKLEFYISILVALKYKDQFSIRPNYKVDHIGKPYSHAPGNNGDIYVYSDDIYWLIEVTLIRNKAQQMNNETTTLVRHLNSDEEFKDYSTKYLSFVAPTVHDDTRAILDVLIVQNQQKDKKINIKPYGINEFIDITSKKENFEDMETYTKTIMTKFRENIGVE